MGIEDIPIAPHSPPKMGNAIELSEVGGPHHRYLRRAA